MIEFTPEFTPEQLDAIRQEHEAFLADLEALAVQALASGDWSEVYAHIHQMSAAKLTLGDCFKSQEDYREAIACQVKPAPKICPVQVLTFSQRPKQTNRRR